MVNAGATVRVRVRARVCVMINARPRASFRVSFRAWAKARPVLVLGFG